MANTGDECIVQLKLLALCGNAILPKGFLTCPYDSSLFTKF